MTTPTAARWQPALRTVPVHLPASPIWSPEDTVTNLPIILPEPRPRGRHRKPREWWRFW